MTEKIFGYQKAWIKSTRTKETPAQKRRRITIALKSLRESQEKYYETKTNE